MERPLFLPLVSLIAGLSLAGIYAYFLPEALLLPLLIISLGTVFLRKPIPFLISLCLIFFFCGNLSVKPLILPELEATKPEGDDFDLEAFIALVEMDAAPGWMVLIIVGRELAVDGAARAAMV